MSDVLTLWLPRFETVALQGKNVVAALIKRLMKLAIRHQMSYD
ncbi:hypothetical protein HMPREF1587_00069 [Bifidobacterium breve JCP7499]|nr:hypothetical protein HMPREF1587_00069 [Bifidobacterium breve JCP7499]